MTPALQARIEKLARECSLILRNSPGYVIERNRGVSISEVDEEISGVVSESLSTLAESISNEKDAEAAELISAVDGLIETAGPVRVRLALERAGHVAVARAVEAVIKANCPTAGRDTLAELERLRERVKGLDARQDYSTLKAIADFSSITEPSR